ncbi:MAG: SUMF1/EgtB/PvdO family nonheme iron enzyme [Hyphomicrobiales bacterium]
MSELPTIRVFISSPSDVRSERLIAERVIKRLDREFAYHFHIEALLWEREPLVASHSFQEKIPPPREADIVVVILWSRLGVPLQGDKFSGPLSAKPVTGTEWEFEDALKSQRERTLPDLLMYRKKAEITTTLSDEDAIYRQLEQKRLVDAFFERWFYDPSVKSFTAAFHEFVDAAVFEETLETHLRALILRRLDGKQEQATIRYTGNPFRGLLSFEAEDAPIFFGRTRATGELRELLTRQEARGCAFVLVMGASGSGKSSVVKAGLLPDLMLPGMVGKVALCRFAVMRPSDGGTDPVGALAAALLATTALPELAGLQYSQATLAAQLASNPGQVAFAVRQGLARAAEQAGLTAKAEARLTLVVDQLEELFTQEATTAETRAAFVAALEALARSGLVWVVATMRSDFFDRLETLPLLANLSAGEARYLLKPPEEAEIGQIIRQPAREAGLVFELDTATGLGLDEAIRRAAARNPGALPLLSFLLDQLWQQRTSDTGTLTFAAYRGLGGLEGALGKRAEAVFEALPAEVGKELPAVLRRLVAVGKDGKATARPAPISAFPDDTPRRGFVEAFLDPRSRLLVADGDAAGAQIRVAHEALLSHWQRAREQIAADARDLELRGRLEEAAERWRGAEKKDRPSLLLAAGLPLAEALALVKNWGADLPSEVADFIARSRQAVRQRRRRLALTLAGAVGSLPVIAGLVWMAVVWSGVRAVEKRMEFASIPGGCFMMGSPESEDGHHANEALHEVCPKSFDLAKLDVTQAQWRRVMVHTADLARFKGKRNPVEMVSWDEARQFVFLMSLFGKRQYRLPSEAEWEYAARAGTTTARYWGERAEDGCAYANMRDRSFKNKYPEEGTTVDCDDGFLFTAPVGSYKPNAFGLYDMLGNVYNWVEDCYLADYADAPKDGGPAAAADCKFRVIRGGAWYTVPHNMRSAARDFYAPDGRGFVGVRLARAVPP